MTKNVCILLCKSVKVTRYEFVKNMHENLKNIYKYNSHIIVVLIDNNNW